MSFERFPYSNFHDLNLDWLLKEIKSMASEVNKMPYVNVLSAEQIQQLDYNAISMGYMAFDSTDNKLVIYRGKNANNEYYWVDTDGNTIIVKEDADNGV